MKISKFYNFVNEDLVSDLSNKLSDENKDIKEDLIKMIQKSVNSDDEKLFIDKVDSIVQNPKESTIEGLIQDADIYEFYLKYRNEIDEILAKNEFFEKLQDFQKENNCISLYDVLVKGTLVATTILVSSIKQEISSPETPQQQAE
jgi:pectate lyase